MYKSKIPNHKEYLINKIINNIKNEFNLPKGIKITEPLIFKKVWFKGKNILHINTFNNSKGYYFLYKIEETNYYILKKLVKGKYKEYCFFESIKEPNYNFILNLLLFFDIHYSYSKKAQKELFKYTQFKEIHFIFHKNFSYEGYSLIENEYIIDYQVKNNIVVFNNISVIKDSILFNIDIEYNLDNDSFVENLVKYNDFIDYLSYYEKNGYISIKDIFYNGIQHIKSQKNTYISSNKLFYYLEGGGNGEKGLLMGTFIKKQKIYYIQIEKSPIMDSYLIKINILNKYKKLTLKFIFTEKNILETSNIFKYCFEIKNEYKSRCKFYSDKNHTYENNSGICLDSRYYSGFMDTAYPFYVFEDKKDKENIIKKRTLFEHIDEDAPFDPLRPHFYEISKNSKYHKFIFKGYRFLRKLENALLEIEASDNTRELLAHKPEGYEEDPEVALALLNFGER